MIKLMNLPQISTSLSIGSVIYFFTLALEYIAAVSKCPPGWTSYHYASTCLKIFHSRKNWDEAKKVCQNEGGDLVNSWSGHKRQFFTDYMELRPDAYWMGFKHKKLCSVYNTSRLHPDHRVKCITQNKFICEVPAVCKENTYGSKCDGANTPWDRISGSCVFGCFDGHQGESCDPGKDYKRKKIHYH
ncbi:hypothetical protein RRG08_033990 [Elysia crispata]|uniref:C-type lectin domain-containing protein n=1 Tax=Elysia crispata TaxID=231223 RepID=A0AAE0XRC3_9GAST|nr:hypothetical protein RRG08_033990 [Elysia crispata]